MSSAPSSPRQMVRSNSNSPPTQVLPPPPPPIDLRHMTSNQGLSLSSSSGRRTSQHFLRTNDTRGLGSPSSIPSSPTSIHSSSSAIFERDIEPILISPMATSPPHSSSLFSSAPPLPLASPSSGVGGHHHVTSVSSTHSTSHSPHKPLDPHRIPRAKATEQLEQSVPSVLDSAAAILANLPPSSPGVGGASGELQGDALDTVQVVAPGHASAGFDNSLFVLGAGGVAGNTTSFASGGGSLVSSGGTGRVGSGSGGRASGFASPLSLRSRSPSPGGTRVPSGPVQGLLNIPSPINTTTTTTTSQQAGSPAGSPHLPSPPLTNPNTTSHPPSPTHAPTKRLSFMSYSDLLASTPTSTHTLASLTTSASSSEPPPHIPSVSGLNIVSSIAASVSNSNSGVCTPTASVSKAGSIRGGLTHPGMRESIALLDNVGGEWEREGMGKGLEERLEEVVGGASPGSTRGVLLPAGGGLGGEGKEVEGRA